MGQERRCVFVAVLITQHGVVIKVDVHYHYLCGDDVVLDVLLQGLRDRLASPVGAHPADVVLREAQEVDRVAGLHHYFHRVVVALQRTHRRLTGA